MKPIPGSLALGLASSLYTIGASAQVASFRTGSSDDITFQWGVPQDATSSNSGNVYFRMEAPTTYSWVGLGIGNRMAGAEIFIMYQNGSNGVTLSPRAGEGNFMPQYSARDDIELLAGSGVNGDAMVANIRCSGCNSLDLGGQNGWIAAWLSGDALDSTDPEDSISVHDAHSSFDVDFSQAVINFDSNPFVDQNGNDSPPSSGDSSSGSGSDSDGGAVSESSGDDDNNRVLAHGVIMTVAFVVLYPLGALLLPILGKWWLHAAWQLVAFILMWAGFALGYMLADDDKVFFDQAHTGIGTIVVALLGLQPAFGLLHHLHFRKNKSRGVVSHVHIWYGRVLIILGIVNGGLGLQLSGETGAFVIAYSVIAGVIALLYVLAKLFGFMRKRRSSKSVNSG